MEYSNDTHNYGLKVELHENHAVKPRTTFWEEVFFSKYSNLRDFLDTLLKNDLQISAFNVIPNSDFYKVDNLNYVSLVKVRHLIRSLNLNECKNIGSFLALMYWFGIQDLHHQNVICGRNENGDLIIAPIDIENIFNHLTHLSQTTLIPSRFVTKQKCGLVKIIDLITEAEDTHKLNFLIYFINTINCLNKNESAILDIIKSNAKYTEEPIRVIIRDTSSYYEKLKKNDFSNLFSSEIVQLKRQDIPYYFRYFNSDQIFYYENYKSIQSADFNINNIEIPNFAILNKNNTNRLLSKNSSLIISLKSIAEMINFNNLKLISLSRLDIFIGKKLNQFILKSGKIEHISYA